MFVHMASAPPTQTIETDIAIVGSGPAGISLSQRLAKDGRTVAIFESGGLVYSDETQQLNEGVDARGRNQLLNYRIRAFGGTSFTWAGWCRPLDRVDFDERDWIRFSGWPITYDEIEKYYESACEICDLSSATFDLESWEERRNQAPLQLTKTDFATSYFQLSPPTRFGEKYRDEFTKSERIRVYLNATVRSVELDRYGRTCDRLMVMRPDGGSVTVKARRFVLACGGIENARLLLVSTSVAPHGVGNDRDLVGRFFMDHPAFNSGKLVAAGRNLQAGLYIYDSVPQIRGFGTLVPTDTLCSSLKIQRFNLELVPEFEGTGQSFSELKQNYWPLGWSVKKGRFFEEFQTNLSRFMNMLSSGSKYAAGKALGGGKVFTGADLRTHLEVSPNPDSRITLDPDRKDRYGLPQARLDWRIADTDFKNLVRGQRRFAEAVGAAGIGRVRLDHHEHFAWKSLQYEAGFHHIGTTRMHESRNLGVVDANCKVHGIDNLYITGSSVFPTSGHANPTLTIVALALRLADHIGQQT